MLLMSFNLNGLFKLFNLNNEKSYLSKKITLEAEQFQLEGKGLAACGTMAEEKNISNVIVLAVENGKNPYVFVDCTTIEQFQQSRDKQLQYYTKYREECEEITFCSYDAKTNKIAVSFATQQLSIYDILELKEENKFFVTEKIFTFFMDKNILHHQLKIVNNIEYIHANKGYILIITSQLYYLFDIDERRVKKVGSGKGIKMMKWGLILDRQQTVFLNCFAKGYNHFNNEESRTGKPTLHFKITDLKKKLRD